MNTNDPTPGISALENEFVKHGANLSTDELLDLIKLLRKERDAWLDNAKAFDKARRNSESELATLKREWNTQTENAKYMQPLRPPTEAEYKMPLLGWILYYALCIFISYSLGIIVGSTFYAR